MITDSCLCTREDVKIALDISETTRANRQIDRAIEAATTTVEGELRRSFRPTLATRYFDWPSERYGTPWRLWLGRHEVISVTSVTSGGVTIPPANRILGPPNAGPPYTYIDIDLSSSSSWAAGDTFQNAIAVTGTFGYADGEQQVGELAGPLADLTTATANVTWSTPDFGVGDLLRIDTEYMVINDRTLIDSTQNLQAPDLTASTANTSVVVTDGTAFAADEFIFIDAERMRVVEIAGNTLIVKRNVDGGTLAAHSAGADIYTLTGVTLGRAVRGSTIGAHLLAAPIYRHIVPPLVRDYAIALSLNQVLQEGAGYARVAGTGDAQREVTGRGLAAYREDALRVHGHQVTVRTV